MMQENRCACAFIPKYLAHLSFLTVLTLPALAAGPIVMIVGPPGSGKTTQAEFLKKDMGFTLIAADDLIAHNHPKFQKYRVKDLNGVDPHLDPAMNGLVEEALTKADPSKGVVLDGYPAAKIQGDFLTGLRNKLQLPPPLVIHLSVPDSVVRSRLDTKKRPELEQQIKDYHREFDFIRDYFPDANIRTIDGTRSPADIAKEIEKIVQGLKE